MRWDRASPESPWATWSSGWATAVATSLGDATWVTKVFATEQVPDLLGVGPARQVASPRASHGAETDTRLRRERGGICRVTSRS